MFEDLVTSVFMSYLSQYIKSLNKDAVTVSLRRGLIELRNVELSEKALSGLAPFSVLRGVVSSLKIDVPWTSIRSKRCEITVEDIVLLVVPCTSVPYSAAATEQSQLAERLAKLSLLDALHETLMKSMLSSSSSGKKKEDMSLAEKIQQTVLNNLAITVRGVTLRYEDCSTTTAALGVSAVLQFPLLSIFATNALFEASFLEDVNAPVSYKVVECTKFSCGLDGETQTSNYLSLMEHDALLRDTPAEFRQRIERANSTCKLCIPGTARLCGKAVMQSLATECHDLTRPTNAFDFYISCDDVISFTPDQVNAAANIVRYLQNASSLSQSLATRPWQLRPSAGHGAAMLWWKHVVAQAARIGRAERQRHGFSWAGYKHWKALCDEYYTLFLRKEGAAWLPKWNEAVDLRRFQTLQQQELSIQDVDCCRQQARIALVQFQKDKNGAMIPPRHFQQQTQSRVVSAAASNSVAVQPLVVTQILQPQPGSVRAAWQRTEELPRHYVHTQISCSIPKYTQVLKQASRHVSHGSNNSRTGDFTFALLGMKVSAEVTLQTSCFKVTCESAEQLQLQDGQAPLIQVITNGKEEERRRNFFSCCVTSSSPRDDDELQNSIVVDIAPVQLTADLLTVASLLGFVKNAPSTASTSQQLLLRGREGTATIDDEIAGASSISVGLTKRPTRFFDDEAEAQRQLRSSSIQRPSGVLTVRCPRLELVAHDVRVQAVNIEITRRACNTSDDVVAAGVENSSSCAPGLLRLQTTGRRLALSSDHVSVLLMCKGEEEEDEDERAVSSIVSSCKEVLRLRGLELVMLQSLLPFFVAMPKADASCRCSHAMLNLPLQQVDKLKSSLAEIAKFTELLLAPGSSAQPPDHLEADGRGEADAAAALRQMRVRRASIARAPRNSLSKENKALALTQITLGASVEIGELVYHTGHAACTIRRSVGRMTRRRLDQSVLTFSSLHVSCGDFLDDVALSLEQSTSSGAGSDAHHHQHGTAASPASSSSSHVAAANRCSALLGRHHHDEQQQQQHVHSGPLRVTSICIDGGTVVLNDQCALFVEYSFAFLSAVFLAAPKELPTAGPEVHPAKPVPTTQFLTRLRNIKMVLLRGQVDDVVLMLGDSTAFNDNNAWPLDAAYDLGGGSGHGAHAVARLGPGAALHQIARSYEASSSSPPALDSSSLVASLDGPSAFLSLSYIVKKSISQLDDPTGGGGEVSAKSHCTLQGAHLTGSLRRAAAVELLLMSVLDQYSPLHRIVFAGRKAGGGGTSRNTPDEKVESSPAAVATTVDMSFMYLSLVMGIDSRVVSDFLPPRGPSLLLEQPSRAQAAAKLLIHATRIMSQTTLMTDGSFEAEMSPSTVQVQLTTDEETEAEGQSLLEGFLNCEGRYKSVKVSVVGKTEEEVCRSKRTVDVTCDGSCDASSPAAIALVAHAVSRIERLGQQRHPQNDSSTSPEQPSSVLLITINRGLLRVQSLNLSLTLCDLSHVSRTGYGDRQDSSTSICTTVGSVQAVKLHPSTFPANMTQLTTTTTATIAAASDEEGDEVERTSSTNEVHVLLVIRPLLDGRPSPCCVELLRSFSTSLDGNSSCCQVGPVVAAIDRQMLLQLAQQASAAAEAYQRNTTVATSPPSPQSLPGASCRRRSIVIKRSVQLSRAIFAFVDAHENTAVEARMKDLRLEGESATDPARQDGKDDDSLENSEGRTSSRASATFTVSLHAMRSPKSNISHQLEEHDDDEKVVAGEDDDVLMYPVGFVLSFAATGNEQQQQRRRDWHVASRDPIMLQLTNATYRRCLTVARSVVEAARLSSAPKVRARAKTALVTRLRGRSLVAAGQGEQQDPSTPIVSPPVLTAVTDTFEMSMSSIISKLCMDGENMTLTIEGLRLLSDAAGCRSLQLRRGCIVSDVNGVDWVALADRGGRGRFTLWHLENFVASSSSSSSPPQEEDRQETAVVVVVNVASSLARLVMSPVHVTRVHDFFSSPLAVVGDASKSNHGGDDDNDDVANRSRYSGRSATATLHEIHRNTFWSELKIENSVLSRSGHMLHFKNDAFNTIVVDLQGQTVFIKKNGGDGTTEAAADENDEPISETCVILADDGVVAIFSNGTIVLPASATSCNFRDSASTIARSPSSRRDNSEAAEDDEERQGRLLGVLRSKFCLVGHCSTVTVADSLKLEIAARADAAKQNDDDAIADNNDEGSPHSPQPNVVSSYSSPARTLKPPVTSIGTVDLQQIELLAFTPNADRYGYFHAKLSVEQAPQKKQQRAGVAGERNSVFNISQIFLATRPSASLFADSVLQEEHSGKENSSNPTSSTTAAAAAAAVVDKGEDEFVVEPFDAIATYSAAASRHFQITAARMNVFLRLRDVSLLRVFYTDSVQGFMASRKFQSKEQRHLLSIIDRISKSTASSSLSSRHVEQSVPFTAAIAVADCDVCFADDVATFVMCRLQSIQLVASTTDETRRQLFASTPAREPPADGAAASAPTPTSAGRGKLVFLMDAEMSLSAAVFGRHGWEQVVRNSMFAAAVDKRLLLNSSDSNTTKGWAEEKFSCSIRQSPIVLNISRSAAARVMSAMQRFQTTVSVSPRRATTSATTTGQKSLLQRRLTHTFENRFSFSILLSFSDRYVEISEPVLGPGIVATAAIPPGTCGNIVIALTDKPEDTATFQLSQIVGGTAFGLVLGEQLLVVSAVHGEESGVLGVIFHSKIAVRNATSKFMEVEQLHAGQPPRRLGRLDSTGERYCSVLLPFAEHHIHGSATKVLISMFPEGYAGDDPGPSPGGDRFDPAVYEATIDVLHMTHHAELPLQLQPSRETGAMDSKKPPVVLLLIELEKDVISSSVTVILKPRFVLYNRIGGAVTIKLSQDQREKSAGNALTSLFTRASSSSTQGKSSRVLYHGVLPHDQKVELLYCLSSKNVLVDAAVTQPSGEQLRTTEPEGFEVTDCIADELDKKKTVHARLVDADGSSFYLHLAFSRSGIIILSVPFWVVNQTQHAIVITNNTVTKRLSSGQLEYVGINPTQGMPFLLGAKTFDIGTVCIRIGLDGKWSANFPTDVGSSGVVESSVDGTDIVRSVSYFVEMNTAAPCYTIRFTPRWMFSNCSTSFRSLQFRMRNLLTSASSSSGDAVGSKGACDSVVTLKEGEFHLNSIGANGGNVLSIRIPPDEVAAGGGGGDAFLVPLWSKDLSVDTAGSHSINIWCSSQEDGGGLRNVARLLVTMKLSNHVMSCVVADLSTTAVHVHNRAMDTVILVGQITSAAGAGGGQLAAAAQNFHAHRLLSHRSHPFLWEEVDLPRRILRLSCTRAAVTNPPSASSVVVDLDFTDGACAVSAEKMLELRGAGLRVTISRPPAQNSTHVEVADIVSGLDSCDDDDEGCRSATFPMQPPGRKCVELDMNLKSVFLVWCGDTSNSNNNNATSKEKPLCALRLDHLVFSLRSAGDAAAAKFFIRRVLWTDEQARQVCGYGFRRPQAARVPQQQLTLDLSDDADVSIACALADTSDGLRRVSSVEVATAVLVISVTDQLIVSLVAPLLEERERLSSRRQQQQNHRAPHMPTTPSADLSAALILVEPCTALYLRLHSLSQSRASYRSGRSNQGDSSTSTDLSVRGTATMSASSTASVAPLFVVESFVIYPVGVNVSLSRVKEDGPDLFRQIVGGYAVMVPTAMKHTEVTLPQLTIGGGRVETFTSLSGNVVQWCVKGMSRQWSKFTSIGNFVDRIGGPSGQVPPGPPPYTPL